MAVLRNIWRFIQKEQGPEAEIRPTLAFKPAPAECLPAIEIEPEDPLWAYFQHNPGVVEIERLNLPASAALGAMKAAGVKIALPLVSQGELIGLLNLGPRRSEQDYSAVDRRLLDNLAAQTAPAVRIAQLAQQQQIEARQRERLAHELSVARLIQQTLLPKSLPTLPGWRVAVHYQPAREVGGDFYDFLAFEDGRMAVLVADVTDKGVPAALVMATTRTLLRAVAQRLVAPGQVLERVNDLLYPDIPPRMFVTCLYLLFDPATGKMQYANAGHDLPYLRRQDGHGVDELRATGMPLGLMPGMTYDQMETTVHRGETILLYSDGLVEAHNPRREMLGFPRLQQLVASHAGGTEMLPFLLAELANFTGPEWEQEDDVTLVILEHTAQVCDAAFPDSQPVLAGNEKADFHVVLPVARPEDEGWHTLAEFILPSEAGNERLAAEQVALTIARFKLPDSRLERLKTAVAEATMNAIEHGNKFRAELPVAIHVLASDTAVAVRITDYGGGQPIPVGETPDLYAKLAGLQSPRGWGLFLIERMVDEMQVSSDDTHHTIALILYLKPVQGEGERHADQEP